MPSKVAHRQAARVTAALVVEMTKINDEEQLK
jgi:hypothetical protein